MQEAFVSLFCPACEANWEEQPHDLALPETDWECPHCGDDRHLAEFMKTPTDLEVLEEFHSTPE